MLSGLFKFILFVVKIPFLLIWELLKLFKRKKEERFIIKKVEECDNGKCSIHFEVQGYENKFLDRFEAENFIRRRKNAN